MSEIVTHGGVDYTWKVCRCGKCGATARCEPGSDFYEDPKDATGPLLCERCTMAVALMPHPSMPPPPPPLPPLTTAEALEWLAANVVGQLQHIALAAVLPDMEVPQSEHSALYVLLLCTLTRCKVEGCDADAHVAALLVAEDLAEEGYVFDVMSDEERGDTCTFPHGKVYEGRKVLAKWLVETKDQLQRNPDWRRRREVAYA